MRIVATHCHPDHLGNAAWLAQRFGCPVLMTHGEFMSAHASTATSARDTRLPTTASSSAGTA